MGDNNTLNRTKYTKENTDEWYTTIETVEEELSHYEDQFKDKIVLCNCDDPFESAFSKYFLKMFNKLGLKKLICTSYKNSKVAGMTMQVPTKNKAYVLQVSSLPGEKNNEVDDYTINQILRKKAQ